MAWTAPRTWVAGEIVTAALGNTHWKDNLRYLKGLDGVPTIESGLIVDNAGGDEYLQIPSLTTTERNALTAVNGMVIYNETTTEFNKYEAGAWVDLGSGVDHGGLDGLGDDDHTQYQKENLLTTAGDIAYATAASTWARLPIGTASQFLRVNAGATAPEWTSGAIPQNGVIIWTGTIASIPAGFVICDGNNGTVNLLTRFIEGVATAATNPGTTGGATNKTTAGHTHSGHTHTLTSNNQNTAGGATDLASAASGTGSTATPSNTDTIADIRPLFYDVAFIMKS